MRSDFAPVQIVEVLNPQIDAAELTGKYILLDVLARDTAGALYNIEMQIRSHAYWNERLAVYLARIFANQLSIGQDYQRVRPAVGIYLMGFEMFDDPGKAHWLFEVRERDKPKVMLTSALQWNLIELPKADRLLGGAKSLSAARTGALAAWVSYFQHWQEAKIMSTITHPPVQKAMERLEALSADSETQRLAEVRERALRDEAAFLETARNEGREEGREEGKLESSLGIARRLLEQSGMDDATIARLTALEEDQVRRLRSRTDGKYALVRGH